MIRLFCFPHAGGNAGTFRKWLGAFPPRIDVWPVELPGHGARVREPPLRRMLPLVERISGELLPHCQVPFALFGHSMGAVVAFELARLLRRRHGIEPVYLFAAGKQAPHLTKVPRRTYELPDSEFTAELVRLKGTSQDLLQNPDLMALVGPILRADFELVQTYSYEVDEALSCPIRAFGGAKDVDVPEETLRAWKSQTVNTFSMSIVDGEHFFVDVAWPVIADVILGDLRAVTRQA